jgi:hypothetical protein
MCGAAAQAARSTAPREVADEVRLLEKRKRDKQVREEASMKAKVQKERAKRDVVWRVEHWKDRQLVKVEDVVETEEDGEEDDSEWDEEEQVPPVASYLRMLATLTTSRAIL